MFFFCLMFVPGIAAQAARLNRLLLSAPSREKPELIYMHPGKTPHWKLPDGSGRYARAPPQVRATVTNSIQWTLPERPPPAVGANSNGIIGDSVGSFGKKGCASSSMRRCDLSGPLVLRCIAAHYLVTRVRTCFCMTSGSDVSVVHSIKVVGFARKGSDMISMSLTFVACFLFR